MKKWRDTSDWIEEYRKPCPDDIAACTARDYERVERQLDELADLTGPESPSVNGLSPRDSAYWSSSTTVNDIEAAVAILLIQRHLTKFGRGPFANPEVARRREEPRYHVGWVRTPQKGRFGRPLYESWLHLPASADIVPQLGRLPDHRRDHGIAKLR